MEVMKERRLNWRAKVIEKPGSLVGKYWQEEDLGEEHERDGGLNSKSRLLVI